MSVFPLSTGLSTVAPLRRKTSAKSKIFEAFFSGCHSSAALHGEQGIAAGRDIQPDVLRRRVQHPLTVRSNFPTEPIILGVSGISRHSRINGKRRSRFIHSGGGWRQLLMKSTPIFPRSISVLTPDQRSWQWSSQLQCLGPYKDGDFCKSWNISWLRNFHHPLLRRRNENDGL